MKIALCFYGQPRQLHEGYKSIKKHILDVYDTDVFYHVWDTEEEKYSTSEFNPYTIRTTLKDIGEVERLYKPKAFKVEMSRVFPVNKEQDIYINSTFAHRKNASNTLSQLYSRNQVCNVFKDYCDRTGTTYDLVIHTRFDIKIIGLPTELDSSMIYTTTIELKNMTSDQLFIFSPTNFIKIFGDIVEKTNRYAEFGYPNNPWESTLQYHPEQLMSASIFDENLFEKCILTPDVNIQLLGTHSIEKKMFYNLYISINPDEIYNIEMLILLLLNQNCAKIINKIVITILKDDNFEHIISHYNSLIKFSDKVVVGLITKDCGVLNNLFSAEALYRHDPTIKTLVLNRNVFYNLWFLKQYDDLVRYSKEDIYLTYYGVEKINSTYLCAKDNHSVYIPNSFFDLLKTHSIDAFLESLDDSTRNYCFTHLNYFLSLYNYKYTKQFLIKSVMNPPEVNTGDMYARNIH